MIIPKILIGMLITFLSMFLNGTLLVKITNHNIRSTAIITNTILAVTLLIRLAKKYLNQRFNLRVSTKKMWLQLLQFIALIVCFATLEFCCDLVASNLDKSTITTYIKSIETADLSLVVTCLLIGLLEEIFFRYYLTSVFRSSSVNIHLAVIASSLLFSLAHCNRYPMMVLAHIFIAGIVFSLLFILSKSILVPIALHVQHNFFARGTPDVIKDASLEDVVLEESYILALFAALLFIWIYKKAWKQDIVSLYAPYHLSNPGLLK